MKKNLATEPFLTVAQAQQLLAEEQVVLTVEYVLLEKACGRVLAHDIFADRAYPPFHRATMDGYAFRHEDISRTSSFRIVEVLAAGQQPTCGLKAGECYQIMTGAAVPQHADTVVKIEDTELESEKQVRMCHPHEIKLGQNIARCGEDVNKDATVLVGGTELRSPEICTLASVGQYYVPVFVMPRVAILSTGDEVVHPAGAVQATQIRNANLFSLQALWAPFHAPITFCAHVKDEPEIIKSNVQNALQCADWVFLTGGVSMGKWDYVPQVLEACGIHKFFHKVQMKPAKPIWVGREKAVKNKWVWALPGNPFSCQVAFKVFVEKVLYQAMGVRDKDGWQLPILETRKQKSTFDEFFPVKVLAQSNGMSVIEKKSNGSGDITTGVDSFGLALHPAQVPYLEHGQFVQVWTW